MTTTEAHVQAYLERVGLAHLGRDRLDLATLVAAHLRTIPFENLDPLAGVPVADLGPDALVDKLVRRRRGGYCYEHNGLLAHVLRALGHAVEVITGRVETEGTLQARTHAALVVTPADGSPRQLVDVGFGGQTLSSPLPFDSTSPQPTRHEPYRLVHEGRARALEACVRRSWRRLYVLDPDPQEQIDLEVGSWYTSTHPDSVFRQGLRVARVTDEGRLTLLDRSFAHHGTDGRTERVELAGPDEVAQVLADRFLIDLSEVPDLDATLTRVATP